MNRLHIVCRGTAVAAVVWMAFWGGAHAQTQTCPAETDAIDASRWTLSADGSEVTDQTTGLVWARCSVGQAWNASVQQCATSATDATAKTPDAQTHEEALALAKATVGWRLPNVKELISLVNAACSAPTIAQNVFKNTSNPNSPRGLNDDMRYWTSTPYAGQSGYAWYVYFSNGGAGYGNRNVNQYVRLVRTSQ